jgi:hypothetical protein
MAIQQETILNYSDNFFTESEAEKIYGYCLNAKYIYGETDNGDGSPVTGMTHNIPEDQYIYKFIAKTIYDRVEFIRDMKLYRMYINCFAPNENPYFHVDGEGYTFLYYSDNEVFDLNEGGETQFLVDNDLMGVLPVPNRMVIFDGTIKHRATTYRSRHRFTIAIKYSPKV